MTLPKKLIWIAVTLLGLASLGVLALSRGEQVNALWIVVAGLCAAAISYRFYSKWLAAKVLVLNLLISAQDQFSAFTCPGQCTWKNLYHPMQTHGSTRRRGSNWSNEGDI